MTSKVKEYVIDDPESLFMYIFSDFANGSVKENSIRRIISNKTYISLSEEKNERLLYLSELESAYRKKSKELRENHLTSSTFHDFHLFLHLMEKKYIPYFVIDKVISKENELQKLEKELNSELKSVSEKEQLENNFKILKNDINILLYPFIFEPLCFSLVFENGPEEKLDEIFLKNSYFFENLANICEKEILSKKLKDLLH